MQKKLKMPSKYLRGKTRAQLKEELRKLQKEPTMKIETSKQYIISKYPWHIDESTFQVLDEEYCLWAARVTTTHRSERKMEELAFPIIVCEKEVFSEMDNHNLQALGEWCLTNKQKG